MSKPGRSKEKLPRRKKKARIGQLILAIVVVAGLASSWILISREPAPGSASQSDAAADTAETEQPEPGMENRMILPAKPQNPRPPCWDANRISSLRLCVRPFSPWAMMHASF